MRKLIVIALVVGSLGVLASVAMAARSIKVGDDYYVRPSGVPTVTVTKGTTVTWKFRGSNPHTVTVSKGPSEVQLRPADQRLVQEEAHEARDLHDLLHRARGLRSEDEAEGQVGSAPRMSAASSNRKIRVVVAKPGLDGHDRGAKIIARALRDAGMEVIYTGLHQTPEQIVETVLQEDADAVGLSILSGAHMTLVPKVIELLRAQDAGDVVVTVGGTIPAQDIPELKELGVAEVFTPGAPTQAIIDYIQGAVTP